MTTTTAQAQEELIVAIDLGFGGVKVATITSALPRRERDERLSTGVEDDHRIEVDVIPSVVGVGSTEMGMLSTGLRRTRREDRPLTIVFDGVSYLVGHNVRRYATPRERLDFLRLAEGPELRALLYAALWKATGGGEHRVALMIGLPVEVVQDRAEAQKTMRKLRHWLVGTHTYTVEGEKITCEVVQVNATAQPLGAYFAWGVNINGRWQMSNDAKTKPVAICDIGFNTLDLFVVEGGQVFKRGTGGATLGMHRVADAIIRRVRDTHRVSLSLHEADELMRTYVEGGTPVLYHAGGETDLSQMVELAMAEGFNGVSQFIRQYWDRGTQFRHFIIVGGGAQAYRQMLLEHYPFAVIMPNAVTANAEGLAKLAYRKYRARGGKK